MSTYGWIADYGRETVLDGSGWRRISFRIDETVAKGNPVLVRGVGFSLSMSGAMNHKTVYAVDSVEWK
ncbi:MAG TPA: hypothetical protein PK624_11425 [Spirochaetota bacterium]|nr:hypothetical protein [Spirochaetota bacterium]